MNKLAVDCPDETSTIRVAEKIAGHLKGGELIELVGDVGAGKTTFVKGLARGIGSKDKVTSPSFSLKNIYNGRLGLIHFDLYRLEEPGLIANEIEDALSRDNSVVVIEWAEISSAVLPENRIIVSFYLDGENSRKLRVSFPEAKPGETR